jgi:hypothetical protein
LYDAVDWFVAVEADVTHQDVHKPFYVSEQLDRFAPFKDKLHVVRATGLPTLKQDADPWAREHAQREFIVAGLQDIGAQADDIILQSDVDEIPRALHARNVRPSGLLSFNQRAHFWSCRWLYPPGWQGTVAATAATVARLGSSPFGKMRDSRNTAPSPPFLRDAGWHLSWMPVGGRSSSETAKAKVGMFCHPEVEERILSGIDEDRFLGGGRHVDGVQMVRCEIDETFPKYVCDGLCPESWLQ